MTSSIHLSRGRPSARWGGALRAGRSCLTIVGVLCFLIVRPTVLPAEPGSGDDVPVPAVLTLGDAERIFLDYSYDLLLTEAASQSARADVTAAGAFSNPAISAGTTRPYRYDHYLCPPPCGGTSTQLGLSDQGAILDLLSGKRNLRVDVARSALDAVRMSGDFAKKNLLFLFRQQFIQTGLAKESLAFAHETAHLAQATLDLVLIRFNAGAVSEADVVRANAALLEANQAVDSASMNYETNRAALLYLLGVRSPRLPPVEIDPGQFHTMRLREGAADSVEKLAALALNDRSDLKALRFQTSRAEYALSLSKRQLFPEVILSLQANRPAEANIAMQQFAAQNVNSEISQISPLSYPGPTYTAPTVSFAATFPIPVLYQSQGEIARAEVDLKSQKILVRRTEAQVVSDVYQAFAAYRASRSKVDRMETSLLKAAKRSMDLVGIQDQKGAASLFEMLDAQRTYFAANQEYFQNLNDYLSSIFQLEQAVGERLRQ